MIFGKDSRCDATKTGSGAFLMTVQMFQVVFPLRQSPRLMLICFCLFGVGHFGIGYQLVFAWLPWSHPRHTLHFCGVHSVR